MAVNIYDLLEKQVRKIFDMVIHQEKHPLRILLPKLKVTEYNLKHKSSHRPKLNTDRVKLRHFLSRRSHRNLYNEQIFLFCYCQSCI